MTRTADGIARCALVLTTLIGACSSDERKQRGQPTLDAGVRDVVSDRTKPAIFDAATHDAASNTVTGDDASNAATDDRGTGDGAGPKAAIEDSGKEADAFRLPAHCANATTPPGSLDCTGLYADVAAKVFAPGVRPYAPAFPLWSDGADKSRWVLLPRGATIDSSDPSEWLFPIGTKFFKEFSKNGRRVETRMWHKVKENFWVNAAYQWNADETEAPRTNGGDITLADGTAYHIPTTDECEQCHRGRTDRILGFGTVQLGVRGASGITLHDLADEGLLSDAPASTELIIGDDGSGLAAAVLGWVHANCGTTCHNGNSRATAYHTGMRLTLDPSLLDGRPVNDFEIYATTVNVPAVSANYAGRTRIVPGRPEQSLLYSLISTRGQGKQMPPIATNRIDDVHTVLIEEWIRRIPESDAGANGGTPDASVGSGGRGGFGGATGGFNGIGGSGGRGGFGGATGGFNGIGGSDDSGGSGGVSNKDGGVGQGGSGGTAAGATGGFDGIGGSDDSGGSGGVSNKDGGVGQGGSGGTATNG